MTDLHISYASVATTRAGRYLAQLCEHTGRLSTLPIHHGTSPMPQHAEWSGSDGVLDFGQGRCTLHATSDGLLLRAEAEDQHQLRRIQEALTARLERIGRRDRLTVTWQPTRPGGPAH